MMQRISDRVKIFAVDRQLLLLLLTLHDRKPHYFQLPVMEEIPEGAKVVDASYDWSRRSFMVMVSHPSYDEVPEGEAVPIVDEVFLEYTQFVKKDVLDLDYVPHEITNDVVEKSKYLREQEATSN